eukprot:5881393-Pyramimonas_sp.AAC.1
MQFSGQRARDALRNEKDQGAEAQACIETAKNLYLRARGRGKHDPGNYSDPWVKFADAVVEQIRKLDS